MEEIKQIEEPLIKNDFQDAKKLKEEKIIKSWGTTKDAYKVANFLSQLFFWWAFRIVKLANNITLKPDYMGKLTGNLKAEKFMNSLENIWITKAYNKIKRRLILMYMLFITNTVIEFFQVYLFNQYIIIFKDEKYEGIIPKEYVGLAYLISKFVYIFFSRQSTKLQSIVGYKSTIELNCLLFNKVTKVSPATVKQKSSEGEIINFMQVDSPKLATLMIGSPMIFITPLQIAVYSYYLFEILGISFIFGFITLMTFLSLNSYINFKYRKIIKEMMKAKDARMKITTETFNNLKVLKLYAWEDEFMRRILDARDKEVEQYKNLFFYSNFNLTMLWAAPIAVSVASIGAYQWLVDDLKIESMFVCITIFNIIQEPIRGLPFFFRNMIDTFVSLKRIETFLRQEDIVEVNLIRNDVETSEMGIAIKVDHCSFSWGKEIKDKPAEENNKEEVTSKPNTPKSRSKKDNLVKVNHVQSSTSAPLLQNEENENENENDKSMITMKTVDNRQGLKSFIEPESNTIEEKQPIEEQEQEEGEGDGIRIILKDISLEVKKGEFIGIIGEVGSGKSSLLQAILNNMITIKHSDESKIIINGKISYVSQVAWIQNDTLRNNILFNSELDEAKYNKVLNICELSDDLDALVGGDLTEIGEKGINLSGGQKARVSIARAVYADSDVYLLDDPISALDANVGENIMKNCFIKELEGKTRILVTHAIQYLKHMDRIIYMKDGEIKWQGTFNQILHEPFYSENALDLNKKRSSNEKLIEDSDNLDEKSKKKEVTEVKRITKDEDKEEGKVQFSVYTTYIKYLGGYWLLTFVLIVILIWQSLKSSSDVWLTYWQKHQDEVYRWKGFGIYAGLGLSSCLFTYIRAFSLSNGSLKLARTLHYQMIHNLIRAPINLFHDTIPKGQILNRLSNDSSTLDASAMWMFGTVLVYFYSFVGSIIVCSLYEILCLIFLPFLMISGILLSRYYINCSRELTRLDGITRSPILNLLGETVPGAITIRAYNFERIYLEKFFERADKNLNIKLYMVGSNMWFGMHLDFLTFSFIVFIILLSTFFKDLEPQSIGIMLTYAVAMQLSLSSLLNVSSIFENAMVAMERCLKYTNIVSEAPYELEADRQLENWPSNGKIEFMNYSTKYRPDTEIILRNLTFEVKGGEKVGIVGRTGSGKSTICLSLFRLLEPVTGTIYIDDVDICNIGLKKLRENLTIIPQDPNLMRGTLKYNIDPLNLYSLTEIEEVLEKIGFSYIVNNHPERFEQQIAESGTNLSVGEKQLICITRAILRKSKIVVMDEATANIDFQTETIIQNAINEILKDCTVITIAHRIKTIIHYDKILVLNEGNIMEYDSPQTLLQNTNSIFYDLYRKSH